MSWESDIARFKAKYKASAREVFVVSAQLVHESITEGSAITGAPGQPVQEGILLRSWHLNITVARFEALTSTPVAYAPSIEDAVSYAHGGTPIQIRSSVGGSHSVKLTRASWQKIVNAAIRQVTGR